MVIEIALVKEANMLLGKGMDTGGDGEAEGEAVAGYGGWRG